MYAVPAAARSELEGPLSLRRRPGRRLLVLLAAVLVACSSGAERDVGQGSSTTAASTPGDTTAGSAPTTVPGAPPAGGPDGMATVPGSAAPDTTAPPPPPSTPAGPSALPAPGGVGSYAPVYLRPAASTRVLVEVRSQSGAEPAPSSIDHVRDVLAAVTGKEVVVRAGTVPGGARSWTADDIRASADTSAVAQSRDGAVLRLLFLRGGFAESDTTLGIAVRADVAAVFSDRVAQAAGFGGRDQIERAVALHEVGHLLGLVDIFLDTGREDPEHPGHSPNRDSVMYYAVESTLVGSILGGGPPTRFDEADRADLAAIRNG